MNARAQQEAERGEQCTSSVAKRAAMAGGVSSVDGHGDGGGIFLVLTLPYLTLPYLCCA